MSKSHDPWQDAMDHAVAVARKSGEMIREVVQNQDQSSLVQTKSSAVDLVTETDQKVERLIIQSVKSKFPSHRFIGEESVSSGEPCILTSDPTWIIDPIDGTTNFVHRYPFVGVCIGFAVNQQVEWGVVYSAIEDKMFTARRGRGAFCNGRPLQVSTQTDVHRSMVATEFGSDRDPQVVDKIFSSLHKVLSLPVHGVRGAGSAALNMCAVARGSVELYYETGVHVWDIAAASVIVTEAGGVLRDTTGGALDLMSRRIVAANNETIATRIIAELEVYSSERDDRAPDCEPE
ncbi:inositol monophosphatase 1 [Periophthalmus magnuspinnatus]|uniref:Inositol-1-monophosphatase n=1 Tax=Periophthalmus magnuspinnatus TaxID=409849 RepID=A0A3B4ACS7_9GOBI|nr:inositol monophosphatase 1 [Periophthalmus magnuspinnatus]